MIHIAERLIKSFVEKSVKVSYSQIINVLAFKKCHGSVTEVSRNPVFMALAEKWKENIWKQPFASNGKNP